MMVMMMMMVMLMLMKMWMCCSSCMMIMMLLISVMMIVRQLKWAVFLCEEPFAVAFGDKHRKLLILSATHISISEHLWIVVARQDVKDLGSAHVVTMTPPWRSESFRMEVALFSTVVFLHPCHGYVQKVKLPIPRSWGVWVVCFETHPWMSRWTPTCCEALSVRSALLRNLQCLVGKVAQPPWERNIVDGTTSKMLQYSQYRFTRTIVGTHSMEATPIETGSLVHENRLDCVRVELWPSDSTSSGRSSLYRDAIPTRVDIAVSKNYVAFFFYM